ncbi:MAG: hypothetical protein ACRD3Q_21205 [Terriglobales bacterium]
MGTSKGYKMPSGGDWTPLKTQATEFVNSNTQGQAGAAAGRALLRNYIKVRSASNSPVSGDGPGATSGKSGGGSGRGVRGRSWGVGVATAQKLGKFFSRVSEIGLADALREAGLGDLVGKSAADVSGALLDHLAGPASTLDEASVREALVALNDELLEEAETFEDVEEALTKTIDDAGMFGVLLRFLGHYIYQCFCTDFYERFVKKVGSTRAAQSIKSIRDCIQAAVKSKLAGIDPKKFSWGGSDARRISEQILGEIRDIFEVPA